MNPVAFEACPPAVRPWLAHHPAASGLDATPDEADLVFVQNGAWRRRVRLGGEPSGVAGLIELMDNNPIVCADEVAVPDPWSAAALLAFGPLARAGLLLDDPALMTSLPEPDDPGLPGRWLTAQGGPGGCVLQSEPADVGTVVLVTGWAVIATPERPEDLDELYEEAYGRSFFVHAAEEADWRPEAVAGTPRAIYRLAIAPSEEVTCLMRVQLMADREGKLGAAQAVHALNVMVGWEESLGLA